MFTIGIDNGVSGGLALFDRNRVLVNAIPMPTYLCGKENKVNLREIRKWMNRHVGQAPVRVIIETPGKHCASIKGLCSMWDAYGRLVALSELYNLDLVTVAPNTWQSVMLPGVKVGDTKGMAARVARELWPDVSFAATPRSKRPHSGMVDAALIAMWAFRQQSKPQ